MGKFCARCKEEKDFINYTKNKSRKDGHSVYCKPCSKIISVEQGEVRKKTRYKWEHSPENWERRKKYKLEWEAKQREKKRILKQQEKETKRLKFIQEEEEHLKLLKSNPDNKFKVCSKCKKEKLESEFIRNDLWCNKCAKEWYLPNKSDKIMKTLRNRLYSAIKNQSGEKQFKTIDLIGCSMYEFKKHIESQFKPGMSWDNHGLHTWHLDHIKPCVSFDLTKPEEQKKCFHYTNLQPLWAKENLSKHDKIFS